MEIIKTSGIFTWLLAEAANEIEVRPIDIEGTFSCDRYFNHGQMQDAYFDISFKTPSFMFKELTSDLTVYGSYKIQKNVLLMTIGIITSAWMCSFRDGKLILTCDDEAMILTKK